MDEYALMVYPIALGKGLPIFSQLRSPRALKLVSSKVFPSGAVAQTYRPARPRLKQRELVDGRAELSCRPFDTKQTLPHDLAREPTR